MNKLSRASDGFVKGTVSLSVAALITKILGVIYKIPLSYILGDEGMGYFNSAYTLYALFFILSTAGIPKAVAMIITEGEDEKTGIRIYRFLLFLALILGSVLTIGFIIFSPLFSASFGTFKTLPGLIAIAPSILFVALGGVIRGYLNARIKLVPIAVSQLIEGAAKLVFGLLFAYIGFSASLPLEIISSLTILGVTLGSLLSLIYMYMKAKNKISKENSGQSIYIDKKDILKRMVSIALPITFSSAIISIGNIFDLGIIMNRLSDLGYNEDTAMALYGNYTTLAIPMLNLVTSVLTPISVAYLPRLVSLRVKGNNEDFNNEFGRLVFMTAFFGAPCAFAYAMYPFELLDILFEASSASVGAGLLSLLAPSALLLPLLTVINTGLEARGKVKSSVISLVFATLFKVAFSYFAIGIPEIGISAVPMGTTISYIFASLISLFVLYKDGVRFNFFKFVAVPSAFAFISFLLSRYLFYFRVGNNSMLHIVFICLFSFIVYLFACVLLKKKLKKVDTNVKVAQIE